MKKLLSLVVAAAVLVPMVWADDDETAQMKEELRLLKEQVKYLTERLETSDRAMASKVDPETKRMEDMALRMTDDSLANHGLLGQARDTSRFAFSGNLDIAAYYMDWNTNSAFAPTANQDTSDVIVDQFLLNLDIAVNEYVSGYVGLQFEDWQNAGNLALGMTGGDTETDGDLQVDQAYIKLRNDMLYAIVGKQYFPFGNVNNYGHFVLDSQVRALYETRDTGITVGVTPSPGIDFSMFIFNGPIDESDNPAGTQVENELEDFGASLVFSAAEEGASYKMGFSALSNLYQANSSRSNAPLGGAVYHEPLPAANAYLELNVEAFYLSGEIVWGLRDGGTWADTGDDDTVMAYTLETAYTAPIGDREYTFAAKYERNRNLNEWTPVDHVYGLAVATELFYKTTLGFNYEYWMMDNIGANTAMPRRHDGDAHVFLTELSIGF